MVFVEIESKPGENLKKKDLVVLRINMKPVKNTEIIVFMKTYPPTGSMCERNFFNIQVLKSEILVFMKTYPPTGSMCERNFNIQVLDSEILVLILPSIFNNVKSFKRLLKI